jgi:cytochrome c biogenesis protein CcdA
VSCGTPHTVAAVPKTLGTNIATGIAMIAGFATIGVILGAALAFAAGRYPRQQATLEVVAGLLLIGGFGLLGYALECVFGRL